MKEQLSFEEAKRLSILKWELMVAGEGLGMHPEIPKELRDIRHHCGFCERYGFDYDMAKLCDECEVGITLGKCNFTDSLFNQWLSSKAVDKKEYAIKMLEAIKQLKVNS